MITPPQIRRKARRLWDGGRLLRAWLGEEDTLFPWAIPLQRPRGAQLLQRFAAVRAWKEAIEAEGEGYRIEYVEIADRRLGRQRLPERVVFESPELLAAYLGKSAALSRFARLSQTLRARYPVLKEWIGRYPLRVLEHADDWPRVLAVLDYFLAYPRPDRYLRELLIPEVDSKFIEGHKRLLWDLLDLVLSADTVDATVAGLAHHGFERRFGLRYDQPLIRFRLLDPALARVFGGLDDISIPLDAFVRLNLPCRWVFITENKTNGLSFPPLAGGMVVFGLGYGVDALGEAVWLGERELYYWGDLDTHGFAILSQFRNHFPGLRSLLMDRDTLLSCRRAWVQEHPDKRFSGEPGHLNSAELALFRDLRDDCLGQRVRLEQERIPFDRVQAALGRINHEPARRLRPTHRSTGTVSGISVIR